MALVALTAFLFLLSVNATPRIEAQAVSEGVAVAEFAVLPDDDAYIATVAVGPDGQVYTGSYASGAAWVIDAEGTPNEIPGTRENIESITGMTLADDGTLYILARLTSDVRGSGGAIWRIPPGGSLESFGTIDDVQGFLSPQDIVTDSAGRIYVSDRGRFEVWRFDPATGAGQPWWRVPAESQDVIPTGLAYDRANDAIIITDVGSNSVYRASVADGESEIVYQYDATVDTPGLISAAVGPDGTLYLLALDQNALGILQDGELVYIARRFRGSSDVAIGPAGELYVANFDSRSLLLPGVEPQLPFALDVVRVGVETEEEVEQE